MSNLDMYIVYEADATRYEIAVMYINNPTSDYHTQYVVSLTNFGECFFESDLDFLAEAIIKKSERLSVVDAVNIQNGIAMYDSETRKVSFDFGKREVVYL